MTKESSSVLVQIGPVYRLPPASWNVVSLLALGEGRVKSCIRSLIEDSLRNHPGRDWTLPVPHVRVALVDRGEIDDTRQFLADIGRRAKAAGLGLTLMDDACGLAWFEVTCIVPRRGRE